jgi:hypothetical protein
LFFVIETIGILMPIAAHAVLIQSSKHFIGASLQVNSSHFATDDTIGARHQTILRMPAPTLQFLALPHQYSRSPAATTAPPPYS